MIRAFSLALLFACNTEPSPSAETPEEKGATSAQIEPPEQSDEAQPEPRSVQEIPRPRIHARHILVAHSAASSAPPEMNRTKDAAQKIAEQLLEQLVRGVSFEDLAKQHSDDGSSKRGGDLGVFTKGVMHKNFEEATLNLQIGERSEVIETPFGFHIIERLEVVEVHVAHVLVQWVGLKRTTSERSRDDAVLVAEQALAELNAGRAFPEVANKFSDGPFGSRGGNLGWFQKGQMVPQFDEVAFALQVGETSAIVESPHGFHIIHRIE
jgi:peptidyl-prolyl cis-trans isomerase NIMA-interacting 1